MKHTHRMGYPHGMMTMNYHSKGNFRREALLFSNTDYSCFNIDSLFKLDRHSAKE